MAFLLYEAEAVLQVVGSFPAGTLKEVLVTLHGAELIHSLSLASSVVSFEVEVISFGCLQIWADHET